MGLKDICNRVLSAITLGKYETNFFFRKQQLHFSYVATLITLMGVALLLYLSISLLKSTINMEQYSVQVSYNGPDSVENYRVSNFINTINPRIVMNEHISSCEARNISGKYDVLINSVLSCTMNDGYTPTQAQYSMTCPGAYLNATTIYPDKLDGYDYDFSRFQRIFFTCTCLNQDNYTDCQYPLTRVFIYYDSYYQFNGKIEYKTQYAPAFVMNLNESYTFDAQPFLYNSTESVFTSDYNSLVYFSMSPIPITKPLLKSKGVSYLQFSFNYQKQNIETFVVIPYTLSQAISSIGGYLSIFSLGLVVLKYFHGLNFNRNLQSYVKKNHSSQMDIGEVYSYENIASMSIELQQLRKQKNHDKDDIEDDEQENGMKEKLLNHQNNYEINQITTDPSIKQ